jgi:hypothetical protein
MNGGSRDGRRAKRRDGVGGGGTGGNEATSDTDSE